MLHTYHTSGKEQLSWAVSVASLASIPPPQQMGCLGREARDCVSKITWLGRCSPGFKPDHCHFVPTLLCVCFASGTPTQNPRPQQPLFPPVVGKSMWEQVWTHQEGLWLPGSASQGGLDASSEAANIPEGMRPGPFQHRAWKWVSLWKQATADILEGGPWSVLFFVPIHQVARKARPEGMFVVFSNIWLSSLV